MPTRCRGIQPTKRSVLLVTTEHSHGSCENALLPETQQQFDNIKQEQRSDSDHRVSRNW